MFFDGSIQNQRKSDAVRETERIAGEIWLREVKVNSRARVAGLVFVERILPLSWEQRQSLWAQMLVGGSHLAALFFPGKRKQGQS